MKPEAAVDAYRALLGRYDHPRIVELGIAYGGSTAFFALAGDPALLVAVEYDDQPVHALAGLVRERHIEDRVRPYYGVDQADRERLRQIVLSELDGAALDLVIDDASHQYAKTVASFETLFPLLRPGGEYVVEDWSCDHPIGRLLAAALEDPSLPTHAWARDLMAGRDSGGRRGQTGLGTVAARLLGAPPAVRDEPMPRPLSRLAADLALALAEGSDALDRLTIDEHWIVVRRGPATLDPTSFRLADLVVDRFGTLAP